MIVVRVMWQEQEAAECSFKPKIRGLPSFIKHMAAARRLLYPRDVDSASAT